MNIAATIVAASASLVASSQALGAQFTITSLMVDAPHGLFAHVGPQSPNEVRIGGVIGPVAGVSAMTITMTMDFSFVENVISGDSLASRVMLRPEFTGGTFGATEMRLSAGVYDDGVFVWDVEGTPYQPLQNIDSGVLRLFHIFTDTFEGPGPAFSTIADSGVGRFEVTFHWTGFTGGDNLSIDFGPGGQTSRLNYWNFIPAPGGGAALLGLMIPGVRRRRRSAPGLIPTRP